MGCVAIIGAGHGGVQAAASLRDGGFDGRIVLIGDERHDPYHRPPLSKGFLEDPSPGVMALRGPRFFHDAGIELLSGDAVKAVDAATRSLRLASGREIVAEHVVLATGSRPRRLPVDGADMASVISLRTVDDAIRLGGSVKKAGRTVIIGGGFIGMELAHTLTTLGNRATVVEAQDRILARAVAPELSAHLQARSVAAGITVLTGFGVARIVGRQGRVVAVELTDGRLLPADLVVVGIGSVPNTELAQAAGFAVSNGIVVDACLRASAPGFYAIGDCASFPQAQSGAMLRLESVQNATDQARAVARTILGDTASYADVPWFWSDQGDMKVQTAGLAIGADERLVTGNPPDNAFSVHHLRDGRLIATDSVNRPSDHMLVRRLLAQGIGVARSDLLQGNAHLKQLLAQS